MDKTIFAFKFSICRFEYGPTIQSLHSTKRGAYKAMVRHKNEYFYSDRELGTDPEDIGKMELWEISEYPLLD